MPVVETAPPVTARPCAPVAAFSSAQVAPPCAVTVARSGSTATSVMSARLIITPAVGHGAAGDVVPAAAHRHLEPRAARERERGDHVAAVRQRTISAGRRSTRPLWTARASS